MQKKPSIKVNFFYNLSYQVLLVIAPLVTTPYISKTLGPENVGIFSYTEAITVYFVLFGVLGLSSYSQMQCSRNRDDKKSFSQLCVECIVCRTITMGLSILVFLIYISICPRYHLIFAIEVLSLLSYLVDCTWLLQGVEDFRTITIRNVFIKILSIVAIFVVVKSVNDLWKYALINCGGTLLGNLLIIPSVKKAIDFTLVNKPLNLKPHFRAAISFFMPTIASVLMSSIDKIMILHITNNEAENGFYEQAVKIESLVFLLFTSFTRTLKPRMAYLHEKGDEEGVKYFIGIAQEFVMLFSIPIGFGIIGISDGFVPWFFGEKFLAVSGILKICACWIFFKAMNNVMIEQYMIPCNKQNIATIVMWFGAFTNVVLNFFLISCFNAKGAAIASVMSECMILLMSFRINKSVIMIRGLINNGYKKIIAGISMLCYLLFVTPFFSLKPSILRTVIEVVSGALVYFLVLLLTRDSTTNRLMNRARNL